MPISVDEFPVYQRLSGVYQAFIRRLSGVYQAFIGFNVLS